MPTHQRPVTREDSRRAIENALNRDDPPVIRLTPGQWRHIDRLKRRARRRRGVLIAAGVTVLLLLGLLAGRASADDGHHGGVGCPVILERYSYPTVKPGPTIPDSEEPCATTTSTSPTPGPPTSTTIGSSWLPTSVPTTTTSGLTPIESAAPPTTSIFSEPTACLTPEGAGLPVCVGGVSVIAPAGPAVAVPGSPTFTG